MLGGMREGGEMDGALEGDELLHILTRWGMAFERMNV